MYTCSSVIRSCFPPSSWPRADDERSAFQLLTLSSSRPLSSGNSSSFLPLTPLPPPLYSFYSSSISKISPNISTDEEKWKNPSKISTLLDIFSFTFQFFSTSSCESTRNRPTDSSQTRNTSFFPFFPFTREIGKVKMGKRLGIHIVVGRILARISRGILLDGGGESRSGRMINELLLKPRALISGRY